MLAFCKGAMSLNKQDSLRSKTWKGFITLDRIQDTSTPRYKSVPLISWMRRSDTNPRVKKATSTCKGTISAPLPLSPSPPWLVPTVNLRPRRAAASIPPAAPIHRAKNSGLDQSYRIISAPHTAPHEVRAVKKREDHRPELPWPTRPLVPSIVDLQIASSSSTSSTESTASAYSTQTDSLHDSHYDDGLDILSVLLRWIAYDAISASTIHHHLGYVEDGGRVLPLGRVPRNAVRFLSPARRYSSLMGVSLAIMEGRLPRALISY